VTPALRLAISLVLSLLLWLPTIPGALAASEDPAWMAGRYLLSLLVARFGVGMVFRVIATFAAASATDEAEAEDEAPEPDDVELLFGRRRSDADAGITEEEALDEALDDAASQAALVP
jgi:hypothetical protein